MMRRYPEGAQVFAKFATVDPENQVTPLIGAYHRFLATGDLAGVEQALAKVPAGFDPGCQITGTRVGIAMLQRRFTEAVALGTRCKESFIPASGGAQIPIEYFIAQVKWLGNNRKPPAEADKARVLLEKMLAERPDLADARMHLASTLAMLGQRQRAIAEADRALADMPVSRDALTGAALRRAAVEVYANSGAEERAIEELEDALELPNGGHAHEVRLDPMLDPLRGDPRFQKLIEKHLPKKG
jgi:tetratricopeptide (TPR) repeat protein